MIRDPRHPLAGRRVLVVEDQYLVADEMRRMVTDLGGEVLGPVARAGLGLDILAREPLDLALLDINLGASDVYPLAMELLQREVLFLFVTGSEPWVIPEIFQEAPRLEKPLTSKTLADAVQRLWL